MAKAPAKPANPYDDLDDDARYQVEIAAPFKVGRAWVRPGQKATLTGRIIKDNADGVSAVQPLDR
ncbi:hypothetical protein DEM27_31855 [Metarhizobium album]|uniref:Uncharacterized protein n=1 Tax=Metarhizobium album TaxID=2182425 RepID=A0A2U2DG46_9HYPH|nr:hypothetical protein [Rhizobium album]PWE52244.1 hypothetical protein DEM27_31855 [Rhizobium album]